MEANKKERHPLFVHIRYNLLGKRKKCHLSASYKNSYAVLHVASAGKVIKREEMASVFTLATELLGATVVFTRPITGDLGLTASPRLFCRWHSLTKQWVMGKFSQQSRPLQASLVIFVELHPAELDHRTDSKHQPAQNTTAELQRTNVNLPWAHVAQQTSTSKHHVIDTLSKIST